MGLILGFISELFELYCYLILFYLAIGDRLTGQDGIGKLIKYVKRKNLIFTVPLTHYEKLLLNDSSRLSIFIYRMLKYLIACMIVFIYLLIPCLSY